MIYYGGKLFFWIGKKEHSMEMNYFLAIVLGLFLMSTISGMASKKMTSEKGIMRPRRPRNFFVSTYICSTVLSALTYFTNFGPGSNLGSVSFVLGMNCAFCVWLIARPFSYRRLLSNWWDWSPKKKKKTPLGGFLFYVKTIISMISFFLL